MQFNTGLFYLRSFCQVLTHEDPKITIFYMDRVTSLTLRYQKKKQHSCKSKDKCNLCILCDAYQSRCGNTRALNVTVASEQETTMKHTDILQAIRQIKIGRVGR